MNRIRRAVEGCLTLAALALWLLWTNPCDPDLKIIRFYITAQDSLHAAWKIDVPIYTVMAVDTLWRSHPCMPDSLVFASACRSAATRYAVACTAIDTTGRNESKPSNNGIPIDFVALP